MIHLALLLIYLNIVQPGDCAKKLNPTLETHGDEAKQENDG